MCMQLDQQYPSFSQMTNADDKLDMNDRDHCLYALMGYFCHLWYLIDRPTRVDACTIKGHLPTPSPPQCHGDGMHMAGRRYLQATSVNDIKLDVVDEDYGLYVLVDFLDVYVILLHQR